MSEFDNTVILYDEDGEEYEFEIVDRIPYKGKTYDVLWCEDDDSMVVATKNGDDYETIHDEDVLEYVKKAFSQSLDDLMDEADKFAAESDFMKELNAIMEDTDTQTEKNVDSTPEAIASDIDFAPFDPATYTQQSQDYLFVEANAAYVKDDYAKALEQFKSADAQGNIYSATRIGMMYYYGYGCTKNVETALEYFQKGALNGCPLAAAWISECYRLGYGVDKDKEYAQKLYSKVDSDLRKMCDSGDMAALYFLGYNMVMGIGSEENEEEGVRLLTLACQKGEKRAAVQLADCYYNGWGVEKNQETTVKLLLKNPNPSNKKAQFLLGKCYYYGNGTAKDLNKAFFHFKIAASLGHGSAKDYLGDCYYNGEGTSVDYVEAAKWYKDAADNNGIGNSAHSLAFMYLNGKGVEKNERTAMQYFLIAAQKGIIQAQRIVSNEYISGEYFEQDYEAARMWMEKAAEQGDPEAQFTLGRYYMSDLGFNSDQKSFEWFMKAAQQGYADAEYTVGGCYLYNIYVDTDVHEANLWFEKAVKHGHAKAAYELGVNYLDGRGINKDSEHGLQLLITASNAGVHEAHRELADRYYLGIENYKGQEKYSNPSEAQKYAMLAVQDEKDGVAQLRLATILHISFGNPSSAKEWYIRAVNNGNNEAKLELSKLYIEQSENYSEAFNMLRELTLDNIDKSKFLEAQYWISVCLENGYGCPKDKKLAKKYYKMAVDNGYVDTAQPKKKRFGIF